eukprot:7339735-Pyramimonas_sp.AAC.1
MLSLHLEGPADHRHSGSLANALTRFGCSLLRGVEAQGIQLGGGASLDSPRSSGRTHAANRKPLELAICIPKVPSYPLFRAAIWEV